MTDRDALRDALAEALRAVSPSIEDDAEADADAILAHPAVLAALDNPAGVHCDCGREHHIVQYRDRSDPAVGLREAAQRFLDASELVNNLTIGDGPAYGDGWASYDDARDTLRDALAATPGPINEHERMCPDCQRVIADERRAALAATPTASPTEAES